MSIKNKDLFGRKSSGCDVGVCWAVWSVYIVPRTGLAQTFKRTEMLQKPP